jgi:CoA:oxalate CoA-transferase
LVGRTRDGQGRYLPISMVSSLLSMNAAAVSAYEIDGPNGVQVAKDTAPYGFYRTTNGFVAIAVTMDKFWADLCQVMNRPELIADPRYKDAAVRNRKVREVGAIVEAWTSGLTREDCIERLSDVGVPCGVVSETADLLGSPEWSQADYFVEVEDGVGGSVRLPANPMGFWAGRPRVPAFNEDYDSVMVELEQSEAPPSP